MEKRTLTQAELEVLANKIAKRPKSAVEFNPEKAPITVEELHGQKDELIGLLRKREINIGQDGLDLVFDGINSLLYLATVEKV